jgi:hypothetical protein
MLRNAKWWEIIQSALEELGGQASLAKIYDRTVEIAKAAGRDIPHHIESVVRGTLEDNSAQSERHKRVRDIFYMPEGRGAGIWALKR